MKPRSFLTPSWIIAFLAACGTGDAPTDKVTETPESPWCAGHQWFPDEDQDTFGDIARMETGCLAPDVGWIEAGGDCDDARPDIHPGVAELPDRVDQDCNGLVDDTTNLFDDDGDGFCEDEVGPCSGEALPGDCDDTNFQFAPDAPELCDGLDNNCDGALPDNELDLDQDGVVACLDCADDDATRYPGAPETCDGVDDNCNLVIDDRDADGDGFPGCGPKAGRLDVLVVVDDSTHTEDEQAALATMAPGLITQLQTRALDWSVGVMAASGTTLVGAASNPRTTDPAGKLAAQVLVGTQGDPHEHPLDAVRAFLASAAGQGWRRPHAALAVIVMSTEDDQSLATLPATLADLTDSIPADAMRVSVLSGGWDGCDTAIRHAVPTPRLARLVDLTSGARADVCKELWEGALGPNWIPVVPRDCDDDDSTVHPAGEELCDAVDNDCDGTADEDQDGDGANSCDGDCDDKDARRHPGAAEACDGVDDDCDFAVPADEADADHDGERVCDGDCNDANAKINPHAAEVCGDGIDQTCDGGDGTVADHADHDGDGYSACAGDCDDNNLRVFPIAPEHAFDGIDNDCDGKIDGADNEIATPYPSVGASTVMQLTSTNTIFRMCGQDFDAISASVDGFAMAGLRSRFDGTPTVAEMQTFAPFLAAGWADLDGSLWTDGYLFEDYGTQAPLWSILRDGGLTLVWDHVPYSIGGGFMTSVAHLGTDTIDVAVLEASTTRPTLVGYACGAGAADTLVLDASSVCLDVGAPAQAAFLGSGGAPAALSTTCTP